MDIEIEKAVAAEVPAGRSGLMLHLDVSVVITDERGNKSAGAKSTTANGAYTSKGVEWAVARKAVEALRDAAYAGALFDFKRDL